MSVRTSIKCALICVIGITPLLAQTEEGKLNLTVGGGMGIPINPTANYAGVGGNFVGGGGYNLDKHNAILGQFMWEGLPPSVSARAQLLGGSASVNLYAITANYQFRGDFGSTFGYYLIAGGGYYYRHSSISKTTQLPPTPVVCQPVWSWYGYECVGGYQSFTQTVGSGTSSFGGNAGVGFTIRVKNTRTKFFLESRYTYAASRLIATQVIPVTFGLMYQ